MNLRGCFQMDHGREHNGQASYCCCYRRLLLRRVGKGSSATVFQVIDSDRIPTDLAIKLFSNKKDCDQEYEILKDIEHNNVVKCFGTPRFVGRERFLMLEMMVKRSLYDIYTKGELKDYEINYFVLQILKAVRYLHALDIAHRDIKGSNCLVGVADELKLADFDKSLKIIGEQVTVGVNPSDWAAPELFHGGPYDAKPADIYSVACTWIEMKNRGRPFKDLGDRCAYGKIPTIPSTVHVEAAELIRRCLNPDPLSRPSAAELLADKFFHAVQNEYSRNVGDEEYPSVLLDTSHTQTPQFLVGNNSPVGHSPSCCMKRVWAWRDKLSERTDAKLSTVEEIFGRIPKRPGHNGCTSVCSLFDLPLTG